MEILFQASTSHQHFSSATAMIKPLGSEVTQASLQNLEIINSVFFLDARITKSKCTLAGCIYSAKLAIFPPFLSFYQSKASFLLIQTIQCIFWLTGSRSPGHAFISLLKTPCKCCLSKGHVQGGLGHNQYLQLPQLTVVRTLLMLGC